MVLGSFVAKEKQIPHAGLVVDLSRKVSLPVVSDRTPVASPYHGNFVVSLSKIVTVFLLVLLSVNPVIPVFAGELLPDFSDLAGTEISSETITDESIVPSVTETEATSEISATTETVDLTDDATMTDDPQVTTTESEPPQGETLFEKITEAITDIFNPDNLAEVSDEIAPSTEEALIQEDSINATSTEETIISDEETATSTENIIIPQEETTIENNTTNDGTTDPSNSGGQAEQNDPQVTDGNATSTENVIISEEETAIDTSTEGVTEEEEIISTEEVITENAIPVFTTPEEPTPIAQPKVFFKDNECTETDDGGYYCISKNLGSTTTAPVLSPRVYSEVLANGKEIYYEDVNGKVQITQNEYDDDAPSYDERNGIILWHALINGRYQIMSFERNSSSTGIRQLTNTSYNNTNPYVSGKGAVWQGWVNDNWEIFYVKDVTAPSFEIRQITSISQNDMFPNLSEKFITWQSFFEETWHVFVYDIETGETSQITKTINGKYENPRFALLFEKRDENGMVQTIGYDIASGKEIPISHGNSPSSPLSLPQADNDKAMPFPASTGTTTVKTTEKDGEGGE